MTYDRKLFSNRGRARDGAVVSHSAELVRGNFLYMVPLKRLDGACPDLSFPDN